MPSTDRSPAIVVPSYNRPASLRRLLDCLHAANYSGFQKIELVISLDGGADHEVEHIARSFEWKFGSKRLISHARRLGLRDHVLACGDLTGEYHSIVLLEDDLMVSPQFYQYAMHALAFYRTDFSIAGVSLYGFIYNEFAQLPFGALDDGNDVYFVRTGVSWGQVWTARQWDGFRRWLRVNGDRENFAAVPLVVSQWPETSWKKYFNAYMEATGKYFVVPRFAMSTNMGDPGTHFPKPVTYFTAPLSIGRTTFRFLPLADSKCRYDAFFEMEPECLKAHAPALADYDLCVDLNGTKALSQIHGEYVLSPRRASNPAMTFGFRHMPLELNIVLAEPGDFFTLARRRNLRDLPKEKMEKPRYFFHGPVGD